MNRLLAASQRLAGGLNLEQVLKPMLKEAMGAEADIARAVILDRRDNNGSMGTFQTFGVGKAAQTYAYLDEQIFELARSSEILVVPLADQFRKLRFSVHRPASLLAVPVRSEGEYIGALWFGYQRVHPFSEAEQKFMATLAAQTGLVISNVRLFQSAETGRQRLQAVITSSPDPILVIDENNQLLLMNDAARQANGLIVPADEGAPVDQVITNPDMLALLRSEAQDDTLTREIGLPDNRSYSASVKWVHSGERRIGKVCVLREITQYKEIDKMKTEFVSTVSHELRSPLQMMRGYATMLDMVGDLNEQQKAYHQKILNNVDEMAKLVDNILDLERIDSGGELIMQQVDLCTIVVAAIRSIMPHAVQKKIEITYDQPAEPIITLADQALISRAIINLLDNSVRFSDMGGKINLDICETEGNVSLSIKDTGHGIAPIDLPHLFERNYRRAKRDPSAGARTGLGLAIVHSIIQRHNGEISVESQLGKGSTFLIRLPLITDRPSGKDKENTTA